MPNVVPSANLYGVAIGTSSNDIAIPFLSTRAPGSSDTNFPIGKRWILNAPGSPTASAEYALTAISSASGSLVANWVLLGGTSSDVNTLTGDSGGAISPSSGNITLAGGTGISTVGSGSTITFNVTGSGLEFTVVTANTQMAINLGYITNKAGTAAAMTLPVTAAVGSVLRIVGLGATGWSIAQNASQQIDMNSVSTTVGVGGSLASSARYNCVTLLCTVADNEWCVVDSEGTLTVT